MVYYFIIMCIRIAQKDSILCCSIQFYFYSVPPPPLVVLTYLLFDTSSHVYRWRRTCLTWALDPHPSQNSLTSWSAWRAAPSWRVCKIFIRNSPFNPLSFWPRTCYFFWTTDRRKTSSPSPSSTWWWGEEAPSQQAAQERECLPASTWTFWTGNAPSFMYKLH